MDIQPSFPVEGVTFILGNNLAGGRILDSPELTPVSLVKWPDQLLPKYPDAFLACTVTRVMFK